MKEKFSIDVTSDFNPIYSNESKYYNGNTTYMNTHIKEKENNKKSYVYETTSLDLSKKVIIIFIIFITVLIGIYFFKKKKNIFTNIDSRIKDICDSRPDVKDRLMIAADYLKYKGEESDIRQLALYALIENPETLYTTIGVISEYNESLRKYTEKRTTEMLTARNTERNARRSYGNNNYEDRFEEGTRFQENSELMSPQYESMPQYNSNGYIERRDRPFVY